MNWLKLTINPCVIKRDLFLNQMISGCVYENEKAKEHFKQ